MINEVLWKLSLCTLPIPKESENGIFDRIPQILVPKFDISFFDQSDENI
jgi:hypothetical protein